MPEAWKEVENGYEYDAGPPITGRRVYIRDDSVSGTGDEATLPTIGTTTMVDIDGGSVTGCLARRFEAEWDKGVPKRTYFFSEYGTQRGSGPVPESQQFIQFQSGIETISISGSNSGWVWDFDNEPVNDQVYKNIYAGTFVLFQAGLSSAQNTTFLATVAGMAGKINDDTFYNFAAGRVYFAGIEGGGYENDNGTELYSYRLIFKFRIINDPTTTITSNDWLYAWNPETGNWDKPKWYNGSSYVYLYASGDFTTLI